MAADPVSSCDAQPESRQSAECHTTESRQEDHLVPVVSCSQHGPHLAKTRGAFYRVQKVYSGFPRLWSNILLQSVYDLVWSGFEHKERIHFNTLAGCSSTRERACDLSSRVLRLHDLPGRRLRSRCRLPDGSKCAGRPRCWSLVRAYYGAPSGSPMPTALPLNQNRSRCPGR